MTREEVLDLLAELMKLHGPEPIRSKSREEILAKLKADLDLAAKTPSGVQMIDLLLTAVNTIYERGRASVQISE